MTSYRAIMPLAAAGVLAMGPTPATAQSGDGAVLENMRQCATIADVAARVACYDSNIRAGQPGAAPARSQPPAAAAPGFGGESVRVVRPPKEKASRPPRQEEREHVGRVTAAVERERGIYLLTLDDGAQWQFVSTAPETYDPPRAGSTVEISRGTLGSFLLTYEGQQSVRVIRVR